MKKISLFTLFTAFSISILFTSCGGGSDNDDDVSDTTKPVITNFLPVDGTVINIGDAIHVTADVADNEALGSYKIDIHNNFDGHGSHSKSIESRGIVESAPFAATRTGELSGKNAKIDVTIDVPLTIGEGDDRKLVQGGNYHLVLYVVDKAGNQTVAYRDIVLN